MTDMDSVRARSFGAVAAEYDRYRPRYPDQLVDDVVAMVPGRQLLEVGAGTGIATVPFAARGMALTCVEPDPEMAAVLSAKVADNPDVRVEIATFEDWSSARPADDPAFDGLFSGQAWHWTDPETRWARAHAALREGGVIALFWNDDTFADPRVLPAITAAYDRQGMEIRPVQMRVEETTDEEMPEHWPERHRTADRYFTGLRTHRYEWSRRMTVVDYVTRLNTTSAHLILPAAQRDGLTAELTTALTAFGDELELAMITDMATAVRR